MSTSRHHSRLVLKVKAAEIYALTRLYESYFPVPPMAAIANRFVSKLAAVFEPLFGQDVFPARLAYCLIFPTQKKKGTRSSRTGRKTTHIAVVEKREGLKWLTSLSVGDTSPAEQVQQHPTNNCNNVSIQFRRPDSSLRAGRFRR